MRVYSSPKPTQPDSSTIGEAKSRPQNCKRQRRAGRSTQWGERCHGGALSPTRAEIVRLRGPCSTSYCVQPEIPPNTGNIIRLCANSGCRCTGRPLGFELDRRAVRRAGLDYAELASVRMHAAWRLPRGAPARACSASRPAAARRYSEAAFAPAMRSCSAPRRAGCRRRCSRVPGASGSSGIPMRAGNRSLNLSNAVALVVYEAWRQQDFRATPDAEG